MITSDMIAGVTGFNRFYSNILNLVNGQIITEGYSLTEAKVLFEIGKTDRCTANLLINQLNIDRSYMSRIIARFEKNQMINKSQSPTDSRMYYIRLTEKGIQVFNKLNDIQNEQISDLFNKMSEENQKLVMDAMMMIKNKLSDVTDVIHIRPFHTSDIEYVISRHKTLYYAERHLSNVFFDYVDKIVYDFANHFKPEEEFLHIFECNKNPAGSIAIVKVDEETAQLRFLMLEPELRGKGYGNQLIDSALDFCKLRNYKHVVLLTISAQVIARHIFSRCGFTMTDSWDKSEWGEGIIEERWDLYL